jgi:endonuclease/exonuclease/phosphatase family metal-dependent hydrolase
MWCLNKKLDDAFEFIAQGDFDILCLQEVPEVFLPRLRSLPFHMAVGQDSKWHEMGKGETADYLVVLSKHPIMKSEVRALPSLKQSWRVIATRTVMKLLTPTRVSAIYGREILFADIQIGDIVLRVFSVHFPLLYPEARLSEFKIASEQILSGHTIMCGDFNVLDNWLMKPLNWVQGGHLIQAFPWYNERAHIDKEFKKVGFANPLGGLVTQKISHSQLDHILIPEKAELLARAVLPDTHGSDHNPVIIRCRV